MKKIFIRFAVVMGIAVPSLVFAQSTAQNVSAQCATYTLACLISKVIGYFQQFITLIIALAMLVFVWNIFNYFFKADVSNKKDAGLYVLYSVIGFFVILSIWGLVAILKNTLNLPTTQPMWPFGGSGSYYGTQLSPSGRGGVSPTFDANLRYGTP
jgi:cellulose synthase/poly-beta-1,6-N-acetylglucosamine synthase-like glycosyltransferase